MNKKSFENFNDLLRKKLSVLIHMTYSTHTVFCCLKRKMQKIFSYNRAHLISLLCIILFSSMHVLTSNIEVSCRTRRNVQRKNSTTHIKCISSASFKWFWSCTIIFFFFIFGMKLSEFYKIHTTSADSLKWFCQLNYVTSVKNLKMYNCLVVRLFFNFFHSIRSYTVYVQSTHSNYKR